MQPAPMFGDTDTSTPTRWPLWVWICGAVGLVGLGATLAIEVMPPSDLRAVVAGTMSSGLVATVLVWMHRRAIVRLTADAKAARAALQIIVDTTPAALLLLDEDMRIVRSNRTAARIHPTPLEGRACYEAIAGSSRACPSCPARQVMRSGTSLTAGYEHVDPRTGEALSVDCHPVDAADGKRYTLLVERIVTEQKKLQARLIHQEKMAAFGLLAAGIAHDMGNPLSAIAMHLDLVDDSSVPPESADSLRTIRQEVGRLRRILRELVDFARRRRSEEALVSVQSVVDDALHLVRHDPRTRLVEVEVTVDPEAPPVQAVEDHLMQVVLNLVLNALDAMPSGGTLAVDVRGRGRMLVLTVRDTGHGMDAGVLEHCFEPLFTTKAAGTGLGLSISRDIVRAARGELVLSSERGKGTTATMSLPAAHVAEAAA